MGGIYNVEPMIIAASNVIVQPSFGVLAVLFIILAASLWVFVQLVRRESRHKRSIAMGEWASSHGLRLVGTEHSGDAGAKLEPLAALSPTVVWMITGPATTITQVVTDNSRAVAPADALPSTWNILLLPIESDWPATALRPTAHSASIADIFSLSSFPSLAANERFMVFGTQPAAARALADSSARALLPADVGLVLQGHFLILDFTTRRFDEIEFGRMLALADQLAPLLGVYAEAK